jgi:hypothetical protein
VYNASQSFATINGDTYNVSAYAQQAQNGASPPDCSISICVYNSCSTPAQLQTGVWTQYYYLFLATFDDDSAMATFSITCVGNAYVGLDNIEVVDIPPADTSNHPQPTDGSAPSASSNGAAPGTADDGSMSMTTLPGGSVRTVTRTIVRTRTTSAIVSTAIYYTTTQISYVVSTYESDNTYTTLQPTTLVSTAYATATSYQTFTASAIVTSTSKYIFISILSCISCALASYSAPLVLDHEIHLLPILYQRSLRSQDFSRPLRVKPRASWFSLEEAHQRYIWLTRISVSYHHAKPDLHSAHYRH